MAQISTIGLDIAKSVFQVHGVDAEGVTVLRRRLTRARLLEFFAKIEPCREGSKPAPHHTTGRENFARSAMTSD
jgi:transposase